MHARGWFPDEERTACATAMGRAHGRRPDTNISLGRLHQVNKSTTDIGAWPFVICVTPCHGYIPKYSTRSGNHEFRRISADVLR